MSPAPQHVTDSSSTSSRPTRGASACVEVSSSFADRDARHPLKYATRFTRCPPRVPRRRRLPPGEAGLRRRLTTLASGCCARDARSYKTYCHSRRSLASLASAVRGTRGTQMMSCGSFLLGIWEVRLGERARPIRVAAVVVNAMLELRE